MNDLNLAKFYSGQISILMEDISFHRNALEAKMASMKRTQEESLHFGVKRIKIEYCSDDCPPEYINVFPMEDSKVDIPLLSIFYSYPEDKYDDMWREEQQSVRFDNGKTSIERLSEIIGNCLVLDRNGAESLTKLMSNLMALYASRENDQV